MNNSSKDNFSKSLDFQCIIHKIQCERALNYYLLSLFKTESKNNFEQITTKLNSIIPKSYLKPINHTEQENSGEDDYNELNQYLEENNLTIPQNKFEFFQIFEDSVSDIDNLRKEISRSQFSSNLFTLFGKLFVDFDDIEIQNQKLNEELAKLKYEKLKTRITMNDEEPKTPQRQINFDFSTPNISIDERFHELKEELRCINEQGKELITQKSNLEREISKLIKGDNIKHEETELEREIQEISREISHLNTKYTILKMENKRLNNELNNKK